MKDVIIFVASVQDPGKTDEFKTEYEVPGSFDPEGTYSFYYDEPQHLGMGGSVTTRYEIRPGIATVIREGDVTAEMNFVPGKTVPFCYSIAEGNINMAVRTKKLDCRLNEHGGSVFIRYGLYAGDRKISDNEITLNIREK